MTQPVYRKPEPFEIRPAQASDLPALAAIEQACFSIPWSEQALSDTFASDSSRFWVAVADTGQIAGYLACLVVCDRAEILNLAVWPAFRRRQIASRLIETLLAFAKSGQLSTVDLEVRSGNQAAIALYRAHGFEPVGRRPRYYADSGEDADIMLKAIDT